MTTPKKPNAFFKKYLDPRWQKMRLEIMERDGFACVSCGKTEETLHVHHGYYEKDTDPWEYPPESLWTLCPLCHEAAEEFRIEARRALATIHPSRHWGAGLAIMAIKALDRPEALDCMAFYCLYDAHSIFTATALHVNQMRDLEAATLYRDMSEWIAGPDCWETVPS